MFYTTSVFCLFHWIRKHFLSDLRCSTQHLLLLANVGLEVRAYYTTPHNVDRSLFNSSSAENATLTTQTPPLIRYPNGQLSPYFNMQEKALYALILVCLIFQIYFTLVVYGSYQSVFDMKMHNYACFQVPNRQNNQNPHNGKYQSSIKYPQHTRY